MDHQILAVYFDLGGVYYTEGFRDGLFAVARKHGLVEEEFYMAATKVVFASGYVRGEAPEAEFWNQLANATDIKEDIFMERETILAAFKPLPGMKELVARIREQVPVGMLTDQCNWLYELDDRDELLIDFDTVVNSYEEGYTKHDVEIFRIACQRFGLLPEEIAFIDDNEGNVDRANEFGIRSFLFESANQTELVLRMEGLEFPAAFSGI